MDQQPVEMPSAVRRPGLLGRRRDFLVNHRYQLRASLLTAAAVLVLLVLLSLVLYSVSVSSTNHVLADSPELAKMIKAQNRLQLFLILLASVVFLAGVFVVSILESHRTAGAAAKLARYMNRVEQGRYNIQLHLRKDDHLQDVQTAFNQMTRGLRDRVWHEVETIERLADHSRDIKTQEDAERLAGEIRELAGRMRRTVE
jgi:methyl-accepting chemotaxis protein